MSLTLAQAFPFPTTATPVRPTLHSVQAGGGPTVPAPPPNAPPTTGGPAGGTPAVGAAASGGPARDAAASQAALTKAPVTPAASKDVGATAKNGGGSLKSIALYGMAGAVLGAVFPIIPGGPMGGALIGAILALLG